MRVVSLLPSATEIVDALGLRDQLVGVTHECDYPPGVERLPRLTASLIPSEMSSLEIDRAVSASLKEDAHTIYGLDTDMLRDLRPDVILTQSLCDVCAVPTSMVEDAVCTMPLGARIVSLDPLSLDGVLTSIEQAADALGVPSEGQAVAARLREEIETIKTTVSGAPRPSVLAAEWLEPVYCGGHWVPEMIDIAGGRDGFGAPGERSHPVPWGDVRAADPDVIVLMPCGFVAAEVVARYEEIAKTPGWHDLRAVRNDAVYAVDATSYYSRPGPRVVEGVRILARILHPDSISEPLHAGAAYRLDSGAFVEFR